MSQVPDSLAGQSMQQSFQALAEHTTDFVVRWDRKLRRVYVNPAFARSMGVSAQELMGTMAGSPISTSPFQDDVAAEKLRATLQRVIDTGQPSEYLGPWTKKVGRIFTHIRFIPECDAAGNVLFVLGLGRDITAVKEIEERLLTLAENSPDVIARVDRNHKVLFANHALERLSAQTLDRLLGARLDDLTLLALEPRKDYAP